MRAGLEVAGMRERGDVDDRAIALAASLVPVPCLAVLVLGVREHVGRVAVEPDLHDLPVALVLAPAEQMLRVVVAPEPVLEPGAAAILLHAPVHALAVAGVGLEPTTGLQVVAGLVDPVAGLDVIAGQQCQREAGSGARDDRAAGALERVVAVVGDRGRRHRAIGLLWVVDERRLVALEPGVERAHASTSVAAAARRCSRRAGGPSRSSPRTSAAWSAASRAGGMCDRSASRNRRISPLNAAC